MLPLNSAPAGSVTQHAQQAPQLYSSASSVVRRTEDSRSHRRGNETVATGIESARKCSSTADVPPPGRSYGPPYESYGKPRRDVRHRRTGRGDGPSAPDPELRPDRGGIPLRGGRRVCRLVGGGTRRALPLPGRLGDRIAHAAAAARCDGTGRRDDVRDPGDAEGRGGRHGGARGPGDGPAVHGDHRRAGPAQLQRLAERPPPARRRQPGQRSGDRTAGSPARYGTGAGGLRRPRAADRAGRGAVREAADSAGPADVARYAGDAPLPGVRRPAAGRGRGGPAPRPGRRLLPAGPDPSAVAAARPDHRRRAGPRPGRPLVRAAAPGGEVGGPGRR